MEVSIPKQKKPSVKLLELKVRKPNASTKDNLNHGRTQNVIDVVPCKIVIIELRK